MVLPSSLKIGLPDRSPPICSDFKTFADFPGLPYTLGLVVLKDELREEIRCQLEQLNTEVHGGDANRIICWICEFFNLQKSPDSNKITVMQNIPEEGPESTRYDDLIKLQGLSGEYDLSPKGIAELIQFVAEQGVNVSGDPRWGEIMTLHPKPPQLIRSLGSKKYIS